MNNQIQMNRRNYLLAIICIVAVFFGARWLGEKTLSEDTMSVLTVIDILFLVVFLAYFLKERIHFLGKHWQNYFYKCTIPLTVLTAVISFSSIGVVDGLGIFSFLQIPVVFWYMGGPIGFPLFLFASFIVASLESIGILTLYSFFVTGEQKEENFWKR